MDSQRQAAGDDAGDRPLWFNPPDGEDNRRPGIRNTSGCQPGEP
jgi:hypothetical protein